MKILTIILKIFLHYTSLFYLLVGRAAMVGFFMAYLVDALTGLDVVGQTGNFICKARLFVTVVSVILLRQTKDFENLKNLADEATFYEKQWQASWQDQNTSALEQTEKKILFASLYKLFFHCVTKS